MGKHKIKLVDALNSFLDRYENGQTVTSYRGDLDHMIAELLKIPYVGGMIANVSSLDVQNYVGKLRKYKPAGRERYAPATVNKKIKSIRAFFAWALRSKIITENPAIEIRNPRLPDDSRKMKIITAAELDKLLLYCSFPFRERERALVMFVGSTGVRRGGCATLRVRDVDFEGRKVSVTEKGAKTHDVYPGDAALIAVRDWLRRRGNFDAESFVFSRDGKPITAPAISQFYRRTCILAGIGSRGLHEIRRFVITEMLDSGVNPETVRRAVNHADIETTFSYVKKTTDDVREAMEAFAARRKVETPRFRILPKSDERAEIG